ncbi:MAG TPA: DNA repair protein RecN [Myxococcota bacterium]|nr:DNA repair protein RecN [Myxococcota bacterium]
MIESLRIESLAVVAAVELELGPGLSVVTGETGAGKSLVLGALALLAGGRASAEIVRAGADEARVEAVLRVDGLPALEAELRARGFAVEDGTVIVERAVSAAGRSRARIGGALVPVAALAELFGPHIEISSQHESQALLRPESHARLLDEVGGHRALRERVEARARAARALDEELAGLRRESEERARREDFLAFQVREIDDARLAPGELERLRAERGRLLHAGRLGEEATASAALLAGDPSSSDTPGALDLVAQAVRRLEAIAALDPEVAAAAERLRAAEVELADLAREIERYASGIEADPARLAEVEERLAQLERLQRKYGASAADILAFRDAAAAERAALGDADARIEKLAAEREAESAALARDAEALTRARTKASRALEKEVEAALPALAMPGARFRAALAPLAPPDGLPCGPSGAESVEFLFSANADLEPRPLRRVASGGELSRVFLALKGALRRADAGTTLVFDEVDAGIGGGVADRVGLALAQLAETHQVLCITHLTQVAARGGRHLVVRKDRSGAVSVEVVDAAARVEEIARMAGGETITDATRRHARDLLKAAAPKK